MLLDSRQTPAVRAALFHASLAQALCDQALAVREQTGVWRVGLAGGVFQNRVLTEQVQARLAAVGFEVLLPRVLPVNDAVISLWVNSSRRAPLMPLAEPARGTDGRAELSFVIRTSAWRTATAAA